jgi:DnaJ-class molecular chaperone
VIAHLRIEDEAADQRDEYNEEPSQHTDESEEVTCFAVLGISPAATIAEVKEAYKLHVKQNHPDRVQGMSPRFRELAEIQTKKLNVAYEEALLALREREGMASHAMA